MYYTLFICHHIVFKIELLNNKIQVMISTMIDYGLVAEVMVKIQN